MARIAFVLVGLVGCDLVYGLRGRTEQDAAPGVVDAPIDQPIDAAEGTCAKDPARADDEDDDDFPNSCDNCPHVAQIDQADGDGDNVGDACDPRLGPHDSIDYFDGFDSVPNGLELLPSATAWRIEGGRLVAFGVPQPGDRLARLGHAVGNAQVITRLSLLVTDADPESAGIWARLGTPQGVTSYPPGVVLEIQRIIGGSRGCHIFETYQVNSPIDCAHDAQLFQTTQAYTMSLDCTEGSQPECHGVIAWGSGATHREVPIDWANATIATGAVGLRAYSVDTAFDYIVVIRHD